MSSFLFPDYTADAVPPGSDGAKALGAFYTDVQVADFLVWWALRSPQDTVMDPCFGGGVFLRSACKRVLQLGGQPASQVFGAEIDAEVHARIAEKLADEFKVNGQNLRLADFFGLDPASSPRVSAIVGNPPFIRYQRFSGEARKQALMRCRRQGVRIPELCSSWAPFLVQSIAMLQQGGRLAMVVPMEIGHARYALPVLDHLRLSFGKVTFLTFRKKLFPDLSEDTLLLLAEDKGAPSTGFLLRDLPHAGLLAGVQRHKQWHRLGTRRLDADLLCQGRARLVESFLPRKARELYRELKQRSLTQRLGNLADVGIGYVTGANEFFHLDPQAARQWGIPRRFLRPAVRRGRALSGLRFTADDWRKAVDSGQAGYLLHIEADGDLPEGVRGYLQGGEKQGVHKGYKCRVRSPWYRVPHVHRPDAFLSYMSGIMPRLVANEAGAVAPNSLHMLRLHTHTTLTSDAVAALWQTSLVRLSVEIEGHPLGGGMLKMEPTEAENVVVPWSHGADLSVLTGLAEELDSLVREGDDATAQARADATILQRGMGLSASDCHLLQMAADLLRSRRYSRSAGS